MKTLKRIGRTFQSIFQSNGFRGVVFWCIGMTLVILLIGLLGLIPAYIYSWGTCMFAGVGVVAIITIAVKGIITAWKNSAEGK